MLKTFLDTGVLITAWRGQPSAQMRALTLLSDPQREFISSPFAKLELLPKPQFFQRATEVQFYEQYFAAVRLWVDDYVPLVNEGLKLGKQYGLNALDALHIAAAIIGGADEFVTAERQTSPFNRVADVKLIFIS